MSTKKDLAYLETMRSVITDRAKSFVIFERGTVVVFTEPDAGTDLEGAAKALVQEFGPVMAGGPAGDFSVIVLPDDQGWAVTCHHPDILNLVLPPDVAGDEPEHAIGLLGRSMRDADSKDQRVVHVEDRRATAP